jgi:hypothetical protein
MMSYAVRAKSCWYEESLPHVQKLLSVRDPNLQYADLEVRAVAYSPSFSLSSSSLFQCRMSLKQGACFQYKMSPKG